MAFSTFLMFFLNSLTPARGCNTCWPCYLAWCMCLAVVPRAYPHDVHVYQAAKGMDASYDVLLKLMERFLSRQA